MTTDCLTNTKIICILLIRIDKGRKELFPEESSHRKDEPCAPSPILDLILSLCQCILWLVSSEGPLPCPVSYKCNPGISFLSLGRGIWKYDQISWAENIKKWNVNCVGSWAADATETPPRPGLSHRSGDFSWNPREWISRRNYPQNDIHGWRLYQHQLHAQRNMWQEFRKKYRINSIWQQRADSDRSGQYQSWKCQE